MMNENGKTIKEQAKLFAVSVLKFQAIIIRKYFIKRLLSTYSIRKKFDHKDAFMCC